MDEEDHMFVRLIERLPLPVLRRRNDNSASLVEFVEKRPHDTPGVRVHRALG